MQILLDAILLDWATFSWNEKKKKRIIVTIVQWEIHSEG